MKWVQEREYNIQKVDPKHIQVTLTPFLEKNTAAFTEKLWNLLLSAQNDPMGIPAEFVQQRMEEIEKQKVVLDRRA